MEFLPRSSPLLLFPKLFPVEASSPLLVDWVETPTAHIFKADVPGLSKKDVEVQILEGNILEITGEYKTQPQHGDDKGEVEWHVVERPQGRFVRRFWLPDDEVRISDVKAKIGDGVLTINIPRKQHPTKQIAQKVPIVTSKL